MAPQKIGFIGVRQTSRVGSIENTGNFLHGHAAREIVADHTDINGFPSDEATLATLRETLSHVGFVAATTIGVNNDKPYVGNHEAMADFITRLGLPVVVFGLGSQAPIGATVENARIPAATERLLRVLSDHSKSIAVRGAFTGELMNSLGIKNVEVVGCQSTFFSRRPDFRFPQISPDIAETPIERVSVSITRISPESLFVAEAMKGGATHIGQSAHFEYRLKDLPEGIGLDDIPEDILKLATPGHFNVFSSGRISFADYHRWVREHFEQFYSMPEWFNYMRGRFDLAIGTRFHGNMTAMLSGVPALWIAHDSRTVEFCEHLGLPNAPMEKIRAGVPIRELVAEHLDASRFNKLYPENYARFYAYLERQGVAHRMAPPV